MEFLPLSGGKIYSLCKTKRKTWKGIENITVKSLG